MKEKWWEKSQKIKNLLASSLPIPSFQRKLWEIYRKTNIFLF